MLEKDVAIEPGFELTSNRTDPEFVLKKLWVWAVLKEACYVFLGMHFSRSRMDAFKFIICLKPREAQDPGERLTPSLTARCSAPSEMGNQ